MVAKNIAKDGWRRNMAPGQDMRRERHIFWIRAIYAGEHGAAKGTCHMNKDELLFL